MFSTESHFYLLCIQASELNIKLNVCMYSEDSFNEIDWARRLFFITKWDFRRADAKLLLESSLSNPGQHCSHLVNKWTVHRLFKTVLIGTVSNICVSWKTLLGRSMCLVIYPHRNHKTSGVLLQCGFAVLSTSCCSGDQCQTAPLLALLPSRVLCYPFDSMLRQVRELSWYWKTVLFFF